MVSVYDLVEMASGGGEVDEEITLPGLVGQDGSRGSLGFTPKVQLDVGKVASKAALEEDVVASDDEEVIILIIAFISVDSSNNPLISVD